MSGKTLRRGIVIGALLAALGACGAPGSPTASGGAAPAGGAPAGSASGGAAPAASAPAATARPAPQRLAIGVPDPSLAYLPAYVAWKLGYFEQEGLATEFPQVVGNAIIPSLLSGDIDFTTNLSSIGSHAGQGGPTKIVQFHSVKLQHVLVVNPAITDVQQLNGKRITVQSPGTLPTFEAQKMAEHYGLRDVTFLSAGSEPERLATVDAGASDAYVASVPGNLIAERRGFPTLLRFSTILDVPQAGLGTSEDELRQKPDLIERALRASARALPVVRSNRDDVVRIIADWISLSPEDAGRAYDFVIDTFSTNGIPTEAQQRAYLGLMQETANVPADATLDRIFDFTLARKVANELGLPSE
ncbi:MAG TPA: ABC transporter substrate-binding protein [Chloroflexota bacterium]|nr:ABC transporter substrate-binding protein [Chloroflexota bacterium]